MIPSLPSRTRTFAALTGAAVAMALFSGCSGGNSGDPANRGEFVVRQITTGLGQVFPHRIRQLDEDGAPTTTILNIESVATLQNNVNQANGVLPVATLPVDLVLPEGGAGNHYLLFRFSNNLDVDTILSSAISASTTSSGLTTAISLLTYNPDDESTRVLSGRGFVGGRTYVNRNGAVELVEAVALEDGQVVVRDPIGEGFPRGFTNDDLLVEDSAFVFVADTDDNLSTLESFDPDGTGHLIQINVSNAVRNTEGRVLQQELRTATTVGADPFPADVVGFTGQRTLQIAPGNNEANVDPLSDIMVSFNKPVQPSDVGEFFSRTNLTPAAGGMTLQVRLAATSYTILYYADPVSIADLRTYRITPAYSMPGNEQIEVQVQASAIRAVKDNTPLSSDVATRFTTGQGPGIVNAPVAPDTVYVGVGGSQPGVAVIDLYGYGQGTNGLDPDPITGEPTRDPLDTWFARFNPNIGQQGVNPQVTPGTSTLDAGSDGPFTLVEDTRGNNILIGAPLIGSVTDIHVGCPLDLVFNNSNINSNVNGANQVNPGTQLPAPGNTIGVRGHPNPPRLRFPPPNVSQAIFAEEPTQAGTGTDLLSPGTRPDFRPRQSGFLGPAPPPPSPPPPPAFLPYSFRQQIGHFLYVLDRDNRQVLVLNSNRFTVLDTIRLSDPFDMAFSPSLSVMAVSNFASGTVSFIDTDPLSATFNQIIGESRVDEGPSAIAWQPDGEAICVTCSIANTLNVLSGSDFSLQTSASGNIVNPMDVVVTERYVTTGNLSSVFYAYVLNDNGTVAVYESGPNGTNGIGFDDMIGLVDPSFIRAGSLEPDLTSGQGGFWISHVDEGGNAKISRCELTVSPQNPQPVNQNVGNGFLLPPTFRQKQWSVTESFGGVDPGQPIRTTLSGNTVADFTLDDILNFGTGVNQITTYNSNGVGASVLSHSAKGKVMGAANPHAPYFMFIAYSDTGKIDVIDLVTRVRVTTLDLPGVQTLATYWRQ